METLIAIRLPPGLAKNGTVYQNKNRWINGNLIRWLEGALRPVGGWTQARDVNGGGIHATGFPRGTISWRKNDSSGWLAVGTTGITPAEQLSNTGFESGLTFWLPTGGTVAVVVTDVSKSHAGTNYLQITTAGAVFGDVAGADAGGLQKYYPVNPGDVVTYGGWAYRESGTSVARYVLNTYDSARVLITSVTTSGVAAAAWTQVSNTYAVPAGTAYVSFFAEVSNVTATVARFDDATMTIGAYTRLFVYSAGVLTDITPAGITSGAADGSASTGFSSWGAGNWGAGPWGGGGAAGTITEADTWSLDNFGEILLATLTSDGKIYESTPTTQATQVTNSPSGVRAVVVTPERFVFALGTAGDPRNVAWCSQQARTVWTPSASNSAGSFPLQTNGRLLAGLRTDRETLLFTDADLWSAQYIGGPLYYSFQRRGDNCGLIGPNAKTIAEGAAYWMSDGQFFTYAGAVRSIPCDVSDYVFSDLSRAQKAKITAYPNPSFGEVTWHYPSSSQTGTENDRYVTLNYRAGYWVTGFLARAAACGPGVFSTPQMWDSTGLLYSHESGNDRGGNIAYVESGPLEIGDGDNVVRIQSLIPDEKVLGQVRATFYSSLRPMDSETATGPYTLSSKTDVRVPEARQHRMRLDDNAGAQDFRIGTFRLGAIKGGRRQ